MNNTNALSTFTVGYLLLKVAKKLKPDGTKLCVIFYTKSLSMPNSSHTEWLKQNKLIQTTDLLQTESNKYTFKCKLTL